MAVRFLFGRAGSGKTHHCLQAVKDELLADPASGPALILFIPEQATVQTERMLLSTKDLAGTSRYYTMSFRRLQQMVLKETGFAHRELVGPIGREMILQYLLIRNRQQLRVLAKVADRPGTAARVAAGITEFMQEGILSRHLDAIAEQVTLADRAAKAAGTPVTVPSALLAGKLHDLSRIYAEYLKWLSEGQQADPAALLAETADRLDQCEWLRGAHVWVDGFASFSLQQRYTLARLAQVAGQVEIALLMDPEMLERRQPPESYDLFFRTWQTFQQLRQTFLEANVEIDEPLVLRAPTPSRFRQRPILAQIESQLFETTCPADSAKRKPQTQPEIDIIAAPNRQAEVEAVARKIIDLARVAPQNQALRYRQIAVLVRDLEPYHDIFQTVFAAHGIPYFIDKRRSVSHHPLVELVRALLRLLAENWPVDAVASMLKTGLAPMPRNRADLVENYLLAHGIAGWHSWCGQPWAYLRRFVGADESPAPPSLREQQILNKANYARRILCSLLREWADPSGSKPKTGREWVERLYRVLECMKVPQRLARWQKLASLYGGPGGLEQSQQHERAWGLLVQLLDDLVAGLAEQTMDVEEFQATMEAGLEAFSLPLIPPVVDQVVIGSVERSRQPDITAAFILGFNEGLFPHRASQDVLLCDHERDLLGQLDAQVGLMTGKQRLFDERLLVYIALTRASRYVWLSYAAADETGKTLLPSPYLRAVQAALPGVPVHHLQDPLASLRPDDIGTGWQAATGMLMSARLLASGDGALRPENWRDAWAGLWHWMHENDMELCTQVRRVVAACDYGNGCTLRPEQAQALFAGRLDCSVSQLQEYATCPYRYFASYGLRLKERSEFELAAVELGSFYHRILYKLATKVRQRGQSLRTVSHEVLNQLVNQTTDEEFKAVVEELALAGGREEYLLQRAKTDISSAMRGHVSLWKNSSFEPTALEVGFGMKDGLPALTMNTPKGRTATLRGKIDRIDIAGLAGKSVLAVIDYKRSNRYKLRLDDAFAGLQVQLIAYMKAAMDAASQGHIGDGSPIPGGMYYFNILPTWQKVLPGELVDPAKSQDAKQWQLLGLTNSEYLHAFRDYDEADADGGPWPVNVYMTSSGKLHGNAPAVDTAQFQAVIEHVWASLGKAVDSILDGDFKIHPYKAGQEMPCTYCAYDLLCRFAPEFNDYRPISRSASMKKVLETIGLKSL